MAKTNNTKENAVKDIGIVLYVDGGCRPGYNTSANEKFGGWGVHGYTYNLNEPPKVKRTKKDTPTVKGYQVGSTVGLEQQVVVNQYVDAYGTLSNKDTNNYAEMKGLENALNIIKDTNAKQAHLLLDSQYVIEGVTQRYENWISNGWVTSSGSPVQNKELWNVIAPAYRVMQRNMTVDIEWVKGHAGNLGNGYADQLATKGVYIGRNGLRPENTSKITFSPLAKYRDFKIDISKLFVKNRWYFNESPEVQVSKSGHVVYHLGAHGNDDTLVGKRISDSTAIVVYLKQADPVLQAVKAFHFKLIPNPLNELCMARLDNLLTPATYSEIESEGVDVLSLAPRKLGFTGLCDVRENQITKVIRPSGLTFKLIEVHNFLSGQLDAFIEGIGTYTDVTDRFYKKTKVAKKKDVVEVSELQLKPSDKGIRIPVDVKSLKTEGVETHECGLSVGIDLPSRELLSRIKDSNPHVFIATWRLSECAFRYATILQVGEEYMIWMGKDSSLQIIYPKEMLEGRK